MNNNNGNGKNCLLKAENLHKTYRLDQVMVPVLKGVDLDVRKGEFLAIVGVSGSGKSTLMHLLGALDKPDEGRVIFDGVDIFAAPDIYRDDLRNRSFGFVFQFYHLLPELTVMENVMMPMLVGATVQRWLGSAKQIENQARNVLAKLGLSHRIDHLPAQLSGGERQRVAIARAIINNPVILLADEPTGNLDAGTGGQIFETLVELNQTGQTIIMVTHDNDLAARADRIIRISDGRIDKNV
jgi:lipoprotein-releasing system ATP-binding protein